MQGNCLPLGTTRKPTGSASGNSLISTPSHSPSPSTMSTRMPPILTLQSSQAAEESISRGTRRDYKPYWIKTLEKIHKEAREEMERNSTPQSVRRHPQLMAGLDRKTGSNLVKLENENNIPEHGEGHPKTLAADKVAEWRQLRAG